MAAAIGAAGLLAASIQVFGSSAHAATPAAAGCTGTQWTASWAASPAGAAAPVDPAGGFTVQKTQDQTLRMIIAPHLGGSSLRLHLSNRFGTAPAVFGHVTIGVRTSGAAVSGVHQVTFAGAASVTAAPGQDVVSDPVSMPFTAFTPLAVSIYLPGSQNPPTDHWNANATSYYTPAKGGDQADAASPSAYTRTTASWLTVDGLDVLAPATTRTVVTFGDSITDGFVAGSPLSIPVASSAANVNGRYPDDLQRRIDSAGLPLSVVNAGISGNELTGSLIGLQGPSGVSRFDQDALHQAGVSGVLVMEGINDLGLGGATPDKMIAGYTQVIQQAHAAGVKIWLGTVPPASNAIADGTLLAPNSEKYREQINTWIRGQNLADGVVDFDAALRNPAKPTTLLPAYASPDNLHPSLAGYQVMAATVNLRMLASADPCIPGARTTTAE